MRDRCACCKLITHISGFNFSYSLGARGYITEAAGDVWYSASVMASLLLYGLALFFFILGVIAYGYSFKGHMDGILSCAYPFLPCIVSLLIHVYL